MTINVLILSVMDHLNQKKREINYGSAKESQLYSVIVLMEEHSVTIAGRIEIELVNF